MFTKEPPTCGIDLIKPEERLSLVAYKDQRGIWTNGYGHTKGVKEGDTCTVAQAIDWLIEDTGWAWAEIQKHVQVPLNQYQAGALLSFIFNIGGPEFEKSDLLKVLNTGNYSLVPAEFKKWIYITVDGNKIVDNGLVNRRAKEIAMYTTPV